MKSPVNFLVRAVLAHCHSASAEDIIMQLKQPHALQPGMPSSASKLQSCQSQHMQCYAGLAVCIWV